MILPSLARGPSIAGATDPPRGPSIAGATDPPRGPSTRLDGGAGPAAPFLLQVGARPAALVTPNLSEAGALLGSDPPRRRARGALTPRSRWSAPAARRCSSREAMVGGGESIDWLATRSSVARIALPRRSGGEVHGTWLRAREAQLAGRLAPAAPRRKRPADAEIHRSCAVGAADARRRPRARSPSSAPGSASSTCRAARAEVRRRRHAARGVLRRFEARGRGDRVGLRDRCRHVVAVHALRPTAPARMPAMPVPVPVGPWPVSSPGAIRVGVRVAVSSLRRLQRRRTPSAARSSRSPRRSPKGSLQGLLVASSSRPGPPVSDAAAPKGAALCRRHREPGRRSARRRQLTSCRSRRRSRRRARASVHGESALVYLAIEIGGGELPASPPTPIRCQVSTSWARARDAEPAPIAHAFARAARRRGSHLPHPDPARRRARRSRWQEFFESDVVAVGLRGDLDGDRRARDRQSKPSSRHELAPPWRSRFADRLEELARRSPRRWSRPAPPARAGIGLRDVRRSRRRPVGRRLPHRSRLRRPPRRCAPRHRDVARHRRARRRRDRVHEVDRPFRHRTDRALRSRYDVPHSRRASEAATTPSPRRASSRRAAIPSTFGSAAKATSSRSKTTPARR